MHVSYTTRLCEHEQYVDTETVFANIDQLLSQVFDELFELSIVRMVLDSYQKLWNAVSLEQSDCLLVRSNLSYNFVDYLSLQFTSLRKKVQMLHYWDQVD